MRTKGLELILKVAERCNLNCTYCYYFNRNSSLYERTPALMKDDVVRSIASFVRRAVEDDGFEEIQFDLHGGEPTLYGVERTRALCIYLREELKDVVPVRFTIQTNAVLIDNRWCDLFEEFRVGVGVSIDGNRDVNDRYRLDHKGQGSYDRTVAGLRLLQERARREVFPYPTVLSVITRDMDGREAFRHLVDDLGCRNMDFLLPDETWADNADRLFVGRVLTEVYDEWMTRDDPALSVRVLRSIVSVLLGGPSYLVGFGSAPCDALTIGSDGGVYADDTLRSCGDDFFRTGLNVQDARMTDIRGTFLLSMMRAAEATPPSECSGCSALVACRGGRLVNRWHPEEGFKRRTVFCRSMKNLVGSVREHLSKAV